MRFLCDEMLARLARLLRAAGYDTRLAADGLPDAEVLRIAQEENRVLLTRDRKLAASAHPRGLIVAGRGVTAEAESLSDALPIDWELAPFTRCVVDNSPLRPARADEVARMPEESRILAGPFRTCPTCGRLYWPGSHVKRMTAKLRALAARRA